MLTALVICTVVVVVVPVCTKYDCGVSGSHVSQTHAHIHRHRARSCAEEGQARAYACVLEEQRVRVQEGEPQLDAVRWAAGVSTRIRCLAQVAPAAVRTVTPSQGGGNNAAVQPSQQRPSSFDIVAFQALLQVRGVALGQVGASSYARHSYPGPHQTPP